MKAERIIIIDQPATIIESSVIIDGKFLTTGILSAYWEIILSNNGKYDSSIIRYKIYQLSEKINPIDYTHMKQGIFQLEKGKLFPKNGLYQLPHMFYCH